MACVALLWANRLIPAELTGRGLWETRVFFAVWALSLLHAALRPVFFAWREQFYVAAALCIALPLLSLLNPFSMDAMRVGVEVIQRCPGPAAGLAGLEDSLHCPYRTCT